MVGLRTQRVLLLITPCPDMLSAFRTSPPDVGIGSGTEREGHRHLYVNLTIPSLGRGRRSTKRGVSSNVLNIVVLWNTCSVILYYSHPGVYSPRYNINTLFNRTSLDFLTKVRTRVIAEQMRQNGCFCIFS